MPANPLAGTSKARTPWRFIGPLGITALVSYGSILYAFALLAPAIQQEKNWSAEVVFGAISWGMLIAGLVSTPVGILLDRYGGRNVMCAGSLTCGAGLMLLSIVQTPVQYYAVWTILGLAMALILYEAAFTTINRGIDASPRSAIAATTLFGGFASTVFWPLTFWLNKTVGWRETYLILGLVQVLVCFPLHASLPKLAKPANRAVLLTGTADPVSSYRLRDVLRFPAFWLLACAFASNSFIFAALTVHLITLLHQFGHPLAIIVMYATLIGPMQVVGRIAEMLFARKTDPGTMGVITFAMLPCALLVPFLAATHQWAIAVFCILYGLSNGILTIVRGTVPVMMFGRANIGAIAGALATPTLLAQAAGPIVLAAIMAENWPATTVLTALLIIALASMMFFFSAVLVRHRRSSDRVEDVECRGN